MRHSANRGDGGKKKKGKNRNQIKRPAGYEKYGVARTSFVSYAKDRREPVDKQLVMGRSDDRESRRKARNVKFEADK